MPAVECLGSLALIDTGLEPVMKSSRKLRVGTQSDARLDSDLSTVIAAWPEVPKENKAAILTMVCVSRRSSG